MDFDVCRAEPLLWSQAMVEELTGCLPLPHGLQGSLAGHDKGLDHWAYADLRPRQCRHLVL